jgi:SAM-dependent methyltransferase
MPSLRQVIGLVRYTPLHPQWLLGKRRVPSGLKTLSGTTLDVGAADRWIEQLLPASVHYVSIDYPTTGRDMYGARPHIFADAKALPFADASFDTVFCLEVLEHVPDPALVVSEIARVTRRGGRALISMPFLYPVHDAPYDFQRYSEYGLRRDLDRAGLHVTSFRRRCNAITSAGLLACLAIAGGVQDMKSGSRVLLLPLAGIGVLLINLGAWLLGKAWPDWDHMTDGYEVEARKP